MEAWKKPRRPNNLNRTTRLTFGREVRGQHLTQGRARMANEPNTTLLAVVGKFPGIALATITSVSISMAAIYHAGFAARAGFQSASFFHIQEIIVWAAVMLPLVGIAATFIGLWYEAASRSYIGFAIGGITTIVMLMLMVGPKDLCVASTSRIAVLLIGIFVTAAFSFGYGLFLKSAVVVFSVIALAFIMGTEHAEGLINGDNKDMLVVNDSNKYGAVLRITNDYVMFHEENIGQTILVKMDDVDVIRSYWSEGQNIRCGLLSS